MRSYVAQSTVRTYDEVMAQPDIFNMSAELAAQRALIVEFRQSLEEGGRAKAQEFFHDIASDTNMLLRILQVRYPDMPDEAIAELEKSLPDLVMKAYNTTFPTSVRLTAKDAEVMSKLLANVMVSAEKYKKVIDSLTIKLDVDHSVQHLFESFLLQVVLPNISIPDRMAVSGAAVKWFPTIPAMLQAPHGG